MEPEIEKIEYPKLVDRVKAVIVDTVVIILFMVVCSIIFSSFERVPDNARIAAFVFIFVLYDPIFTSLFGGTLGHMLIGIRVKRVNNEKKNILLPLAIIRFAIKASLGWISLLTVPGNAKKRAIHDSIIGSVVVYFKK